MSEIPTRRVSRRQSLVWLAGSVATAHVARPILARAADSAPGTPSAFAVKLQELAIWVQAQGGQLSAAAADLRSGTSLGAHAPSRALNPASNMKVITAAVALDRLGPQMRFQTGLYGSAVGDALPTLVLRGHGDPSLSESELWRLASSVASRGIKQVGTVLVDQSAFDDRFVPPAFEQQPNEWAAFRAPVSAIALNRNVLTCNVLAGSVAGEPARVWIEPAGAVQTDGKIDTSARGKGQNVQWQLTPSPAGLRSVVGGHVAHGQGRLRYTKRLDDPRRVPGLVLAHQLRGLGLKVGNVELGTQDTLPRLTYQTSAPLPVLLSELGKHSDNFYAEMIFKSLASAEKLPPATTDAAANIVNEWLNTLGPRPADERIVNGSGLFDASRISSGTLVAVLREAHQSARLSAEFVAHLAIGGVDGTLTSRFRPLRERRCIRAKTGTLDNAIALSGYALKNLDQGAAFSIIVNGISGKHHQVRAKIDDAVSALV